MDPSQGPLLLSLNVNFGDTTDKIVVRGLGLILSRLTYYDKLIIEAIEEYFKKDPESKMSAEMQQEDESVCSITRIATPLISLAIIVFTLNSQVKRTGSSPTPDVLILSRY
jgi:hypothetical protein